MQFWSEKTQDLQVFIPLSPSSSIFSFRYPDGQEDKGKAETEVVKDRAEVRDPMEPLKPLEQENQSKLDGQAMVEKGVSK